VTHLQLESIVARFLADRIQIDTVRNLRCKSHKLSCRPHFATFRINDRYSICT